MEADQEVSGEVLGAVLGLTARRVRQLAKEGVLEKTAHGRYRLAPNVKRYIAAIEQRGQASAFDQERIRHEAAKRELAELELAERKGELVPAADSEQATVGLLSGVRAQLLAVPAAVAEEVATEDEPRRCHAIIEEALHQALTSIADVEVEVPPAGRNASDRGAHRRKRGRRS